MIVNGSRITYHSGVRPGVIERTLASVCKRLKRNICEYPITMSVPITIGWFRQARPRLLNIVIEIPDGPVFSIITEVVISRIIIETENHTIRRTRTTTRSATTRSISYLGESGMWKHGENAGQREPNQYKKKEPLRRHRPHHANPHSSHCSTESNISTLLGDSLL